MKMQTLSNDLGKAREVGSGPFAVQISDGSKTNADGPDAATGAQPPVSR